MALCEMAKVITLGFTPAEYTEHHFDTHWGYTTTRATQLFEWSPNFSPLDYPLFPMGTLPNPPISPLSRSETLFKKHTYQTSGRLSASASACACTSCSQSPSYMIVHMPSSPSTGAVWARNRCGIEKRERVNSATRGREIYRAIYLSPYRARMDSGAL